MVIAGLIIGNQGRSFAMSDITREHIDSFWLLTDEILNSVLFVLIGLEAILVTFAPEYLVAGAIITFVVLTIRLLSVSIPLYIIGMVKKPFPKNTAKVLTWGGLRGGISVALAMSLPEGEARDLILVMTFIVVVVSVLIQGLSFEKFMKRFPVVEK